MCYYRYGIELHDIGYHSSGSKSLTVWFPIDDEINDTNCMLIGACCRNRTDQLKEALQTPDSDPTMRDNLPLKEAVIANYFDIIKLLVEDDRVDPSFEDNYCLKQVHYGINPTDHQKEIITFFLKQPEVIAKSIMLDQDHHTENDINWISNKYPELLI